MRSITSEGGVPGAARSEISSFSDASRRRLKWAAANAHPALISQFGMTWHNRRPSGREVKASLNLFLANLRHHFPQAGYMWVLEFQGRGVAHIHLFLTLPAETPGLRMWLGETWHRIAEPESVEHLQFHRDRRQNFISWKMGDAWYVCGYLDKRRQKLVPAGFHGVGRFWGASRLLVPQPVEILAEDMEEPENIVRTLCRHHEANNRKSRYKHRARRTPTSYRLPKSGEAARMLMREANNHPINHPATGEDEK